MKVIAFTSVVLLLLFCSAEGSLLQSLTIFSPTCDTPGVAFLSCTFVEVIRTYIAGLCDSLLVLEAVATAFECVSSFFPYPIKQILQDFFNGVVIGSTELTDVCSTNLNGLNDYVKGECKTLSNLYSFINQFLSPPSLIKGKEILKKIQCLTLILLPFYYRAYISLRDYF